MDAWKTFDWVKDFEIPDLEVIEGSPRLYVVDDATKLPSMTSLLSQLDDGGVDDWRKRVGDEEADRIVAEAVARGNNLHDLSERYLMNKLTRADVKGPATVLFNRNRKYLNQLTLIVAIEAALYSIKDGYAGRVDCIAFHDKDLCIVDHKNARRTLDLSKKYARQKLFTYMVQTCGYARAFHEMYPHLPAPTHGVLIFGFFDTLKSKIFKFKIEPLQKELDIIIDAYYNRRNIKDSRYFSL